jgi:site-specific DNA-methyltransferase (adenine-specific)
VGAQGVSFDLRIGDCREVLPAMVDAFADCCIADPPYGDTSLEWDKPCKGWIPHVARALKPNGSLWVFGSLRFMAPMFAELAAHGFKYSQDLVWEKQNGTGFHADRFRRVHEHVALFYRGPWSKVYHQPQFTMDSRAKVVRRKTRPTHTGHIEAGHYTSVDGGPRHVRSVLKVRNEHGRAIHPTQKPVDVVLPLIRYSCPPDGTVLDPFAGSGTSEAAGRIAGVNVLLIEKSADVAAAARARLRGIAA